MQSIASIASLFATRLDTEREFSDRVFYRCEATTEVGVTESRHLVTGLILVPHLVETEYDPLDHDLRDLGTEGNYHLPPLRPGGIYEVFITSVERNNETGAIIDWDVEVVEVTDRETLKRIRSRKAELDLLEMEDSIPFQFEVQTDPDFGEERIRFDENAEFVEYLSTTLGVPVEAVSNPGTDKGNTGMLRCFLLGKVRVDEFVWKRAIDMCAEMMWELMQDTRPVERFYLHSLQKFPSYNEQNEECAGISLRLTWDSPQPEESE